MKGFFNEMNELYDAIRTNAICLSNINKDRTTNNSILITPQRDFFDFRTTGDKSFEDGICTSRPNFVVWKYNTHFFTYLKRIQLK